MKYKMPGADASQFTQLKKAIAIQGTSLTSKSKSTNKLSYYNPKLSAANASSLSKFIPLVLKAKK